MERDIYGLLICLRVESRQPSQAIIDERWEFNAPKFFDFQSDEGCVDEQWFESEETKKLRTPIDMHDSDDTLSVLSNAADKLKVIRVLKDNLEMEMGQPVSTYMELCKVYDKSRSRRSSSRKRNKKQSKRIISCCRMQ